MTIVPVHVRMFTPLVALSKTKQPSFDVEWREGMTVADIVAAEGFSEQDAEAIAAIVNSEQSEFDRTLHDGDEVEFIVNLQGGAGVDSPVENPARRVDTYHQRSAKHLQRCADEFADRQDAGEWDTAAQMRAIASGLVGKRLRFRAPTA